VLQHDDVGAGSPVLYLHGGGDSRLSRPADDGIATALGVRLVAVDRCGPPVAGRTLASFAREVEELADALSLERFAVLGWSAGGPHALAVAAVLPERVRRVVLAASMPPPDLLHLMPAPVRLASALGRISPRLTRGRLEAWGRRPPPSLPERAHDAPYARGRLEGFRAGGMWLAQELAYLGRPWGFDLGEIRMPVGVWYGEDDHVTPARIGRALAERLPAAELHLVDDGHHILFTRWRDLLEDARRA
jgi:pimeloyl-ACP methyl ester carboxylesterase